MKTRCVAFLQDWIMTSCPSHEEITKASSTVIFLLKSLLKTTQRCYTYVSSQTLLSIQFTMINLCSPEYHIPQVCAYPSWQMHGALPSLPSKFLITVPEQKSYALWGKKQASKKPQLELSVFRLVQLSMPLSSWSKPNCFWSRGTKT